MRESIHDTVLQLKRERIAAQQVFGDELVAAGPDTVPLPSEADTEEFISVAGLVKNDQELDQANKRLGVWQKPVFEGDPPLAGITYFRQRKEFRRRGVTPGFYSVEDSLYIDPQERRPKIQRVLKPIFPKLIARRREATRNATKPEVETAKSILLAPVVSALTELDLASD